jgi:hypothetical protein
MLQIDASYGFVRARHEEENRVVLGGHFAGQHTDVVARRSVDAKTLLSPAWDVRLSAVLFDRNRATAGDYSGRVARGFGGDFDPEVMDEWLAMNATLGAESINATTRERLAAGDADDVYADLAGGRLVQIAASIAATAANFGAHDAARASGATLKMWHVRSGNPRSSHSALNGAAIPIDGVFGNGQRWPGDPAGGVDEVANCQCSLSYVRM